VTAIGLAEDRSVTIVVDRPSRTLEGRVTDASGRPLYDVSVEADFLSRIPITRATDADGRFELEGLVGDHIDLRLRKQGYAPVDVIAEVGSRPLSLVLERGRRLLVRLNDEAGNPVEGASVVARVSSRCSREAARRGPGLFELRDLPGGDVTIQAVCGDHALTQRHDADVPQVTLIVPAPFHK